MPWYASTKIATEEHPFHHNHICHLRLRLSVLMHHRSLSSQKTIFTLCLELPEWQGALEQLFRSSQLDVR